MNDNNTQGGFKAGDVVALISGGPPMTVLHGYGEYTDVAWFTSSDFREDELQSRTFPSVCLELFDWDDDDGDDDDGDRAEPASEVVVLTPVAANSSRPYDPEVQVA